MMISRGSGVSLEIFVVFGQGRVLGFIVLLLHAHLPLGVHLDLWGQQSRHRDELEVRVADQLSRQPQERLLKVVVRLGRDVVVLKKNQIKMVIIKQPSKASSLQPTSKQRKIRTFAEQNFNKDLRK